MNDAQSPSAINRLFWPFWNFAEERPRALWRLLIQTILTGLLASLFIVPANLLLALVGDVPITVDGRSAPLAGYLSLAVGALATTAAVLLAARWVDRRAIRELGLGGRAGWWRDLGFGLALGALLMAGIFVVELAAGWVRITDTFTGDHGQPFAVALLVPIALYLAVGFYEELYARGYVLQNVAEGLNLGAIGARRAVLLGWLLSSLLFGALHAGNPNATATSTAMLVVAGLFLGLGYVLTGELAIPIGLHITWNLFQGNVFGFPVSGTRLSRASVVAIEQGGPDRWTGGAFGPEAGLIGFLAILIGSLLTLVYVRATRGALAIAPPIAEPPDEVTAQRPLEISEPIR